MLVAMIKDDGAYDIFPRLLLDYPGHGASF